MNDLLPICEWRDCENEDHLIGFLRENALSSLRQLREIDLIDGTPETNSVRLLAALSYLQKIERLA